MYYIEIYVYPIWYLYKVLVLVTHLFETLGLGLFLAASEVSGMRAL